MSKMDDMRAMREARFGQATPRAAETKAATKRSKPARPPVAPAPRPAAASDAGSDAGSDVGDERLCGHRAISGRTCTREHGHEAKSHRYS